MPWHRGHTLSIFSALCLSQRNQGRLGVLTQLASLPHPPPAFSLLSPAFARHTVPHHTLLSLSCLRLLIHFHFLVMLLCCGSISPYLPVCLPRSFLYPCCSLCLLMTFELFSLSDKQTELEEEKGMFLLLSFHVSLVSAQGKIGKINWATDKSISIWHVKTEHSDQ